MIGTIPLIVLGIVFYSIGVASTVFFQPAQLSLAPMVSLLVLSLGIFFLSSFYFGKFSFALLLPAGFFLGAGFEQRIVFVFLSLMPLLFATIGGSTVGENAKQDLLGKKNFFDDKDTYFAYAILISVVAILIGIVFAPAAWA